MQALLQSPRQQDHSSARDRSSELASELRTAAMEGDESRIKHVLTELLRLSGMPRGRRVALQLPALVTLVRSLRSLAMTDDLTGLCNRRGFLQIGMRFLDVARRDRQAAHLVYFDLDNLKQINDTAGHAAGDVLLRQAANMLRDLFPSYGVYEVLGRLGGDEFAALTTSTSHALRCAAVLRARQHPGQSGAAPALALSVGVAHFDPNRPIEIGELLEIAEQAMYEHKRISRIAPAAALTRPPGLRAC
jgi:diguanylate cyclase (GGDEF)-like protein